MPLIY